MSATKATINARKQAIHNVIGPPGPENLSPNALNSYDSLFPFSGGGCNRQNKDTMAKEIRAEKGMAT